MSAATAGRGMPVNLEDLPDEIPQALAEFGSALVEHVQTRRDHSWLTTRTACWSRV
jgi:hypothetical protein